MTAHTEMTFPHSRIFAEGWNAARRPSLTDDSKTVAAMNPYKTEPERARWNEGFAKGTQ